MLRVERARAGIGYGRWRGYRGFGNAVPAAGVLIATAYTCGFPQSRIRGGSTDISP